MNLREDKGYAYGARARFTYYKNAGVFAMTSQVSATWVYDCAAGGWKRMDPSQKPPRASGHAMVYDSGANAIVIYGGITVPLNPSLEPPFTKDLWLIRL